MSFDPFAVSSHLRDNFIRYLIESHPIHEQAAGLQEQFERELQVQDRFVREPLVSAIPTYVHDRPVRDLIGRKKPPRLDEHLAEMAGFDLDRPLYRHQVRAIERIQQGRNVVVATGTGSGKTECFLLPILDAAARARAEGRKGVLAILVYPMNALANDQLDRMREMIGASTGITFGRYTSQTPKKLSELSEDQRREAARSPNELATREQIQAEPPQVLLTNFAMLEYLLLRPKDQDIFRHPSLRFVVLDKAHAYNGSQGIDIGLLMRRLRQRYQQKPQFILTSATLGSPGEEGKIADFASRLTGDVYAKEDVITGEVADPFDRALLTDLAPAAVKALAADGNAEAIQSAANDPTRMRKWLGNCGLASAQGTSAGEILYHALCRLRPAAKLYDALIGNARTVVELANDVFSPPAGDEQAECHGVVRTLLTAASFARPAGNYTSRSCRCGCITSSADFRRFGPVVDPEPGWATDGAGGAAHLGGRAPGL